MRVRTVISSNSGYYRRRSSHPFREHWRRRRQICRRYYFYNRKPKGMRNIIKPLPLVWNNIRQNGLFADAFIESSDNLSYRVHRVILAASSDYFRAAFANPLRESSSKILLDFPSSVVECLIEFCYTGVCTVNSDNVESLLAAADEIGILGLIELCCSFLQNHINVKNCWRTHVFCKTYFCGKIAAEARRYVLDHFTEFFQQQEEFLAMSKDDVVSLLSDEFLNVRKEEQVFFAADKWIKHDLTNRQQFATDLLSCVRINFLPKSFYLQNIVTASYFEHVEQSVRDRMARAIVHSPMRLRTTAWSNTDLLLDSAPTFLPRIPHEIVFAIGGWSNGSPTNRIETYDVRANCWFPFHKRDFLSRAYHGVICVNSLIYVIGGFNGSVHFNSVRCFDPVLGFWTEKSCMHHARCYVSCVELDGYIYAIGGFDGNERLSHVEKYSIEKNQWEQVSPMKRARSDAGATVFKNMIYIAGGFSGHMILSSVEVYDPNKDIWSPIVHMYQPRSGVSLITYKGFIYALGGFNGHERLRTVERFHPNFVFWEEVLPMNIPRSNFACTILEDVIFVVGGFNGNLPIPLTECFDGTRWQPLAPMEISRSALAICTLSGLPNTEAYSLSGKLKIRRTFH
ncbi:kelch-like protein 10 isoform X2 [Rhodnius prolixus]|uniref:kelch-like protein 10 isoform X2 n=1 Tax=Rhodnius prolixus TaxID=13249 RepID=UPI003D18CFAB